MAEYYGHFDTSAGVPSYAGDVWRMVLGLLSAGNGVVAKYGNKLAVTATGAGLSVYAASGAMILNGGYYVSTAQQTLNFDAQAAGNNRIDLVIGRMTVASKICDLVVLKGTPGASPTAPALTQSASIWEEAVASVYIAGGATVINAGNITDLRSLLPRVETGNIEDTAVTAGKLASNAVTEAKILDGAVTQGKLGTIAQITMASGDTVTYDAATNRFMLNVAGCTAVQLAPVVFGTGASPPAGTYPKGTLYLVHEA